MKIIDITIELIENHPQTTDLAKWVLLVVVAWASGVFSLLRRLNRRPSVRVSEITSKCLIEKFEEYDGHPNAIRSSLLLEIEISNPSPELIVVKQFELQIYKQHRFSRWGEKTCAIALPNRVRHEMGSGTKFMRNWFANFDDDRNELLSLNGRIEAKDSNSGFALFVTFTCGLWKPKIINDNVRIRVYASLGSGEVLRTSANIPVTTDKTLLEKMVPGVLEQISHPTAWNVPARFVR